MVKAWTVVNFVGTFTGVVAVSLAIYWRWIVQSDIPARVVLGYFVGGSALIMMHFQAFYPGETWALIMRLIAYLALLVWEVYMTLYLHQVYHIEPRDNIPQS